MSYEVKLILGAAAMSFMVAMVFWLLFPSRDSWLAENANIRVDAVESRLKSLESWYVKADVKWPDEKIDELEGTVSDNHEECLDAHKEIHDRLGRIDGMLMTHDPVVRRFDRVLAQINETLAEYAFAGNKKHEEFGHRINRLETLALAVDVVNVFGSPGKQTQSNPHVTAITTADLPAPHLQEPEDSRVPDDGIDAKVDAWIERNKPEPDDQYGVLDWWCLSAPGIKGNIPQNVFGRLRMGYGQVTGCYELSESAKAMTDLRQALASCYRDGINPPDVRV